MGNGEVLNQSPKELETSEKPNSPTSENINSINWNMPRGHNPRSAATTYLKRHLIPRVTKKKKKKKKKNSSSMVVMGFMMTKNQGATDGAGKINYRRTK